MATSISIKGIVKEFPGSLGGRSRAVDGISLDIAPGELFFLLGPSGCGKTTLLRMIAGFIDPTEGQILFDARDVTYTPPNKRNTGMVFQSYALWPHMTVEANVAFGLGLRKVSAEQTRQRVFEALSAVRMEEYAARKPNQLSGGQQQRVALARALVIRPDVLLLDEPLSNLDAKLRLELRLEIRRICKAAGITTVYVTHDQKEALSMADRVAILEAGRVVQLGTPEELYRAPKSRFVAEFLGEANFIPGTVVGTRDGVVEVKTAAGAVHATSDNISGDVTCVVRPEAFRFGSRGLAGTLVESVYLGEAAQHLVEVGGSVVKVLELNPQPGSRRAAGAAVTLESEPSHVVLLPGR
ncbi:MAG: ABC transporter ATP-binding protein [Planctomycetota bacterium]|nr:ABC transporter ATP-binding protein [Planctomycetota bacterium]